MSLFSSAIIEDINVMHKARLASLAYFYFDYKDTHKQTRRDAISSLLFQLSAQSDDCCDILYRLYLVHNSGAQMPSDGILTECLKNMLSLSSKAPTYIIMDAIDECPNTFGTPSPREQILDLIEDLIDLSLPNLRLCVTSRPEIDIQLVLEPLLRPHFRVSLHDAIEQKQDIADYIEAFVYSDRNMRRWREEDKKLVIEELTRRADGMSGPHYVPIRLAHIVYYPGFDGRIANWKSCDAVSHRVSAVLCTSSPKCWPRHTSVY